MHGKRPTSMSDVTEKSTELQYIPEKSVEKSNSCGISQYIEIENEDVILAANSSNSQCTHSSQTTSESLEAMKKKKQMLMSFFCIHQW